MKMKELCKFASLQRVELASTSDLSRKISLLLVSRSNYFHCCHLLSTFCVGNFDYVTANEEVSFENEQVQCVDIQILNDQLTENQEVFRVNLTNGFDILSTTIVVIRSSNSMLL